MTLLDPAPSGHYFPAACTGGRAPGSSFLLPTTNGSQGLFRQRASLSPSPSPSPFSHLATALALSSILHARACTSPKDPGHLQVLLWWCIDLAVRSCSSSIPSANRPSDRVAPIICSEPASPHAAELTCEQRRAATKLGAACPTQWCVPTTLRLPLRPASLLLFPPLSN
jgi:hypothetical protein